MTASFALNLTHEGISLLHNAGDGWVRIGDADFAAPDFTTRLNGLRDIAVRIGGKNFVTKLILPNSQVLYTQATASGLDEIADQSRVENALEGATPYPVQDLAYDWVQTGDTLRIAVVARETLQEAEAFATDNGLNPAAFVAMADTDDFPVEPHFGATSIAPVLLLGREGPQPGELSVQIVDTVDPDTIPDFGENLTPVVKTTVEPQDDPLPEGPVIPVVSDTLPADEPDADDDNDPVDDVTDTLVENEPDDTGDIEETLPEPEASGDDDAETEDDTPADDVEIAAEPVVAFASIRARRGADDTPPPVTPTEDDTAFDDAPPLIKLGGALRAVREENAKTVEPAPTPAPIEAPASPPLAARIRDHIAEAAVDRTPSAPVSDVAVPADAEAMAAFGARQPQMGARPARLGLTLTLILLALLAAVAVWSALFLDDTVSRFFGPADTDAQTPQIASVAPDFAPDGSLTRGLEIATPEPPERPLASDAAPLVAEALRAPTTPALPSNDLQIAALGQEPLSAIPDAPFELAEPIIETPPAAEPNTEISAEELADEEPVFLDQTAAVAAYAATGIWQRPPDRDYVPTEYGLDSLYVASIDPNSLSYDAVALPSDVIRNTDIGLPRQANPIAPGASLDLDENGLVRLTPGGLLSPEGIMVFSGKPALVPPARPGLDAPEITAPDALALLRPKSRPTDLLQQVEKQQFGGVTREQFAEKRPRTRPAAVEATARDVIAARVAAEKAVAEAQAAEAEELRLKAEAEEEAAGTQSALAIAKSIQPKNRPRGLERRAARLQSNDETTTELDRASTAQTGSTRAAVSRSQRLTPKAPTPASVATRATVANAINLSRVNLIGVYGSPSQRRALVRLSSGKYVKVKVGDRVDGGKVAAIGEAELRYVKGGRNVVLKMPRG
jgi:hypothetical protein